MDFTKVLERFWFSSLLRLSEDPRGAKRPPTSPQDGPRGPQDGPETAQEDANTALEAPKTAQECPKTSPREGPRGEPRTECSSLPPQEAARKPQDAPARPQGAPRGRQDAPRRLYEAAEESPNKQKSYILQRFWKDVGLPASCAFQTLQEDPRHPQDRSKTAQEASKTAPRRPERTPKQL